LKKEKLKKKLGKLLKITYPTNQWLFQNSTNTYIKCASLSVSPSLFLVAFETLNPKICLNEASSSLCTWELAGSCAGKDVGLFCEEQVGELRSCGDCW
jgi:hypothetical protein